MNPSDESVAVVVVTFNSAPLLKDLFDSLGPGLWGLSWQLIVVDNDSSDDSAAYARVLAPWSTVIEAGRNGGYAAGINIGVAAAAPHSAVLVLNPDVRLWQGCVAELLRVLRESGAGLAVPRLVDARGQLIDSMRREPTVMRAIGDALLGARRAGLVPILGEVVTDHRHYEMEATTDWAEGSTLLISAECWRRCGPWDEHFFLYSEETDFALRAKDAGLVTRYVPTAGATHLEGESGSSPALWSLLVLNRVRLFRRRNGIVGASAFWGVTLIREVSRAVLGKATSRAAARALLSRTRFREMPGPDSVRREEPLSWP